MRLFVLVCAALLALHSSADATVTVTNTSGGAPVVRLDVNGNAIDAHDGNMIQVGSTFYLYGTSYGCGFIWQNASTPFCGFKVYSSTDLVTWTDQGFLFDASIPLWQGRCQGTGCFRPHVVFNAANNNYVLWINLAAANDYRVFTSSSPTGPFTEQAQPTLQFTVNGDFDLFVDDNGDGYIAYQSQSFEIYIQKLTANYLTGTGTATAIGLHGAGENGEAPAMFKQGSTYFVTFGTPCPYCNGTNTSYRSAATPLGSWSATTLLNSTSCNGQPTFVAKLTIAASTVYLYGSDTWYANAAPPGVNGFFNQGQAQMFWIPLTVGSGAVSAFSCSASFTAALTQEFRPDTPAVDQTAGSTGFNFYCHGNSLTTTNQRMQTFTAGRTGTLNNLRLTAFQSADPSCNLGGCVAPNAPFAWSLVTVDGSNNPSGTLASGTIAQASVSWSPTTYLIPVSVSITAGNKYGIIFASGNSTGCYGFLYNDLNVYPAGVERFSTNSGSTWTTEANRALRFTDLVNSAMMLGVGGSISIGSGAALTVGH